MTTRREVVPPARGGGRCFARFRFARGAAARSEPELKRVSYQSARTGKERDYFVYLPRGFAQAKPWPVMLFLHGDGERGDARANSITCSSTARCSKPGASAATCPS